MPRAYLAGLTLSNDATTPATMLDISAGECRDSSNAVDIILPAFTKSLAGGAWVAGSAHAGLGLGLTLTNATWYHVFAIVNGGSADVYFDTSATALNQPVGTTAFRRIGSIYFSAAGSIFPFVQLGDEFIYVNGSGDVSVSNLGTASQLFRLTVPPGIKVNALLRGFVYSGTAGGLLLLVSSPDQADVAPNSPQGNFTAQNPAAAITGPFTISVRTNTASQIRAVANTANTAFSAFTYGYVDHRNRFN